MEAPAAARVVRAAARGERRLDGANAASMGAGEAACRASTRCRADAPSTTITTLTIMTIAVMTITTTNGAHAAEVVVADTTVPTVKATTMAGQTERTVAPASGPRQEPRSDGRTRAVLDVTAAPPLVW